MRLLPRQRWVILWMAPAVLVGAWVAGRWGWYCYLMYVRSPRAYVQVDLLTLQSLSIDQNEGTTGDIPSQFRKLDGRRVMVEGYMYNPLSDEEQGVEFQFIPKVAYDSHRPPLVQERVYGHVSGAGKPTPLFDMYTFARIYGVLHVRVVKDETGAIHSVYDMDVERTERASGRPWNVVPLPSAEDGAIRESDVLIGAYGSIAIASVAGWLIARRRRQRRLAAGLCPACGYDVRATLERCPECGAAGEYGGVPRSTLIEA